MDKLFVNVSCEHRADGTLRPQKVILPDGRAWDIRRTLHVAEPVEDEFEGIRYTVLIGSAEKYIYRMGTQWYVHPVHTEVDTS
ncbi:hypothetical protein HMPREF1986_00604 [Oribacterium sp. oral taxon 078 str. F0263]|uniref:hypothetical protein n=1 Tax=Oribacterium sp. oral taxon 078 TaxID=652706 RepID=UPI0003AD9C6B|nr:hypothetical protein [Oribacterium sp. oral taxon 078]ERL22340.1 hypothetical protein HMPREF1986_00604 [Oribacterium sp. oral taxon 078 str. F0263]